MDFTYYNKDKNAPVFQKYFEKFQKKSRIILASVKIIRLFFS